MVTEDLDIELDSGIVERNLSAVIVLIQTNWLTLRLILQEIINIYSNTPSKCDTPYVQTAGDSDHLAVLISKFSKELKLKPQTVKKRNCKKLDIGAFLNDVRSSNIDDIVTTISDVDLAAQVFQNIFCSLFYKHAIVKVFQVRKHYVPYLSDETKILMAERDSLKKESIKQNDPILHAELKLKRN